MTSDVFYRCTRCHLEQHAPIRTCRCGGHGFERVAPADTTARLLGNTTIQGYQPNAPHTTRTIIGRDDT
jgi:hypothetical protein